MNMKVNAQVCWRLVAALLSLLRSCAATSFVAVGGNITLESPVVVTTIRQLAWYHNENLVVEYTPANVQYYAGFVGRASVNPVSAELTIRDAGAEDSGTYRLELNSLHLDKRYTVNVIKKVPRPQVRLRTLTCTSESPSCTLSCDGDTAGAGDVSYSWQRGGGWEEGLADTVLVNNETTRSVPHIFCQMKNQVSEDKSEPFDNPLIPVTPVWPVVVGVGVGVAALVAVAAGVAYWKREPLKRLFKKDDGGPRDEQPMPGYSRATQDDPKDA